MRRIPALQLKYNFMNSFDIKDIHKIINEDSIYWDDKLRTFIYVKFIL